MDKFNYKDILDSKGINVNFINGTTYSDKYKQLAEIWSKLPLYQDYENVEKFFDLLNSKQVILLISGTGSGKTVFIPKFFFKYLISLGLPGKIAVTNPKQITTQNNAEYGAHTLDIELGNEVGYGYRNSPSKSKSSMSRLLYVTDGLLLSTIKSGDKLLSEYAGVIIDEAHERNMQIDFLLKMLKDIVLLRKEFKIIIMSATINPEVFKSYFTQNEDITYGEISISGKPNYHIEEIWLEDEPTNYLNNYLKVALNQCIKILNKKNNKDIIIFVPTQNDTIIGCKILKNKDEDSFCIEMHSKTTLENKELAVIKNETKNSKIIITTNVAESSITFDNLYYVIDTGLELINHYDAHFNRYVVKKVYTTQSQITQRIGRTGRTQPGVAYHLYTKEQFNNFKKYPEPNILVSDLSSELLSLLKYYKNVSELQDFFNDLITKPSQEQMNNAIFNLQYYNCITFVDNGRLTSIGKCIQKISSTFTFISGFAIILGKFLNCQTEIIKIMAILNSIDGSIEKLFVYKKLKEFQSYIKKYSHPNSDHLTILNIYEQLYEKDIHKYLNIPVFNQIRKEINTINKNIKDITEENYKHIQDTYNIIKNEPLDVFNDNIIFILYKAYNLYLITNNDGKTINLPNNSQATIEYSSATITQKTNNNLTICNYIINRFNKNLFICCSEIPNYFIKLT